MNNENGFFPPYNSYMAIHIKALQAFYGVLKMFLSQKHKNIFLLTKVLFIRL